VIDHSVGLLVGLSLAACRVEGTFACERDEQCGADGRCEPLGACSFPDPGCADGRRFDELATAPLAGTCVDVALACPAGYTAAISGIGSRYRPVLEPVDWVTAQSRCAADGAGTHLVVIESAAERDGLAGVLREDVWIGYSDRRIEGTFEWVTGSRSEFTAFGGGQPNGGADEDCVQQKAQQQTWADEDCDLAFPYICECDGVSPLPL
jgi:hypothetical protein